MPTGKLNFTICPMTWMEIFVWIGWILRPKLFEVALNLLRSKWIDFQVMEHAPLQSLVECLKDASLRSSLSVRHLCDLAKQICDGMMYLEQHRLVHGNLAARNILVISIYQVWLRQRWKCLSCNQCSIFNAIMPSSENFKVNEWLKSDYYLIFCIFDKFLLNALMTFPTKLEILLWTFLIGYTWS